MWEIYYLCVRWKKKWKLSFWLYIFYCQIFTLKMIYYIYKYLNIWNIPWLSSPSVLHVCVWVCVRLNRLSDFLFHLCSSWCGYWGGGFVVTIEGRQTYTVSGECLVLVFPCFCPIFRPFFLSIFTQNSLYIRNWRKSKRSNTAIPVDHKYIYV